MKTSLSSMSFRQRAFLAILVLAGLAWGVASLGGHVDTCGLPPHWLPDNPNRDSGCKTKLVMDGIIIRPGETVADIGAGAGYFTFKLARLVGDQGLVIATGNNWRGIRHIRRYAQEHGRRNVMARFVLDYQLGFDGPVDKVLMVNLFSFHDSRRVRRYFTKLHERVRPGGELYIFQDATGYPRLGQNWEAYVLSADEMTAALRGLFALEKSLDVASCLDARYAPYFLVFRRI